MDGVQCTSRTYENIQAKDCLLYRTTYDYTKYVEFLRSSLCNYQNSVAKHNHQFFHILQFYTLWLTEIQYNLKRLLWGPVAMVTEAIKNTIGFQAILKANCQ